MAGGLILDSSFVCVAQGPSLRLVASFTELVDLADTLVKRDNMYMSFNDHTMLPPQRLRALENPGDVE